MDSRREHIELLHRGVAALEKIAEDNEPRFEVHAGPPICPNCGKLNPQIRIHDGAVTGHLGEFVIHARCLHCDTDMFGLVESYSMHTNAQSATDEMNTRREAGWLDDGNGDR